MENTLILVYKESHACYFYEWMSSTIEQDYLQQLVNKWIAYKDNWQPRPNKARVYRLGWKLWTLMEHDWNTSSYFQVFWEEVSLYDLWGWKSHKGAWVKNIRGLELICISDHLYEHAHYLNLNICNLNGNTKMFYFKNYI